MALMNKTFVNETVIPDFGTITFIRGILILLLRAGFILIQIGCIPINDVQLILLHNILDISCSTVSYMTVGYILAFGPDMGGIIGNKIWIGSEKINLDDAVLGWAATITTTAIFTTAVAGRMHFLGYVIIILLFSSFIHPLLIHWIWTNSGWMYRCTLGGHKVSYKDQAGAALIHITGGTLALCGGSMLGRRILCIRDIDESSIPPDSPGSVVTGYVFLVIGLMALCLPTDFYEKMYFITNYSGLIILNNIMAAAGGIIMVVMLHFVVDTKDYDYWIMIRCMQGAIAGTVTIASGIDVYNPLVAFAISLAGGIIFFFAAELSFSSVMEDYANLIAIHFICGFIGVFLPPFCGSRKVAHEGSTVVADFTWQALCTFTLLGIMLAFILPLLYFFRSVGILRNHSEITNHQRAKILLRKMSPRSFWQRIFNDGEDFQHYLQPGYRTKQENNFRDDNEEIRNDAISEKTSEPTVIALKTLNSKRVAPVKQTAQANQNDLLTE